MPRPDSSDEEIVAFLAYTVKSRRVSMERTMWGQLIHHQRLLDPVAGSRLAFDLFAVGLEHVQDDDALRADWIRLFSSVIDLDDPVERGRFLAMCEPFRLLEEAPMSRGVIRVVDYLLALRLGKPIDVDHYLEGNPYRTAALEATRGRIRHYLQMEDTARLRRVTPDLVILKELYSKTL